MAINLGGLLLLHERVVGLVNPVPKPQKGNAPGSLLKPLLKAFSKAGDVLT